MCAMMPMLRTLARALSAAATVIPTSSSRRFALPPVMREGLVGLGHLVRVLAPLHGGTEAIAGVEQLVGEALDHGLLATRPRVLHQPAQSEGGLAGRADLDRDLVGRATNAAAADLQGRLDLC